MITPADQPRADSVRLLSVMDTDDGRPARTLASHAGLSPARGVAGLQYLADHQLAAEDENGQWRKS